MRLGEALYRSVPDCPVPIYRFMFSDGFAFGFPPEPSFMESYCDLLTFMKSNSYGFDYLCNRTLFNHRFAHFKYILQLDGGV